ncbi:actin binding Rho activating protein b [Entelurus aequoreus]|uniref:actin binding Rho activating protein b n=1 Tax=Entelurus aequoreus TaxID=161455 RepID=UPI002B1DFEB0|nr:actin binding Rho activating protein b [Entelurus aequoreus]
MSDQQTCQTSQRKASANKNIKKRRNLNTVCGLANSWQQWVSENEAKQAAEPSGWCPSWMGEPTEVPKKTWIPKKSIARQKTKDAQNQAVASKGAPETERVPLISSSIKTKLVVKTVTSHLQERSAGIKFLTNRIEKEPQPSNEDIDRLLKTRLSPTRRRKCTNMVSSLTQSWREMENEQKLQNEGAQEDEQLVGDADAKDARFERQAVNIKDDSGTSLTDSKKTFDAESPVRIKRPQVFMSGKEAVDANKICARSKKFSPVGNLKSRWQNWASEHTDTQKINPFSENFDYDYSMSLRLQKGLDGYGRPKEGTKTAERAKRAEQHIHREIDDMCYIIRIMADPDPDGKTRITFGELFERYVRISDKVVGILMRARKHGKVHFEGEMLWQGQDDGVIITLLV